MRCSSQQRMKIFSISLLLSLALSVAMIKKDNCQIIQIHIQSTFSFSHISSLSPSTDWRCVLSLQHKSSTRHQTYISLSLSRSSNLFEDKCRREEQQQLKHRAHIRNEWNFQRIIRNWIMRRQTHSELVKNLVLIFIFFSFFSRLSVRASSCDIVLNYHWNMKDGAERRWRKKIIQKKTRAAKKAEKRIYFVVSFNKAWKNNLRSRRRM